MSGAGALLTGSEDAKKQDSGMSGRLKIKAAELSRHWLISGAGMELAAPAPPVLAPELMQVWKILSAVPAWWRRRVVCGAPHLPLAPASGCRLGVMLVVWLLPGSGRVTFNNQRSYLKAVTAAFVEIKTTKFTKKVRSWREGLWGSPGSWTCVCV